MTINFGQLLIPVSVFWLFLQSHVLVTALHQQWHGSGPFDILYNDHISSSSAVLTAPIDIYSVNGILDIQLTTQVFRAKNDLFSFNTRAYCLNDVCSIPGPTLHLLPGSELR
jgi:hypothetical protein